MPGPPHRPTGAFADARQTSGRRHGRRSGHARVLASPGLRLDDRRTGQLSGSPGRSNRTRLGPVRSRGSRAAVRRDRKQRDEMAPAVGRAGPEPASLPRRRRETSEIANSPRRPLRAVAADLDRAARVDLVWLGGQPGSARAVARTAAQPLTLGRAAAPAHACHQPWMQRAARRAAPGNATGHETPTVTSLGHAGASDVLESVQWIRA